MVTPLSVPTETDSDVAALLALRAAVSRRTATPSCDALQRSTALRPQGRPVAFPVLGNLKTKFSKASFLGSVRRREPVISYQFVVCSEYRRRVTVCQHRVLPRICHLNNALEPFCRFRLLFLLNPGPGGA
jgi:hypothetical protein